ncbi:homocysteine S-methyltransferase family protein [Candidatus Neomarinimicrobiota bacterium]
MHDDYNISLLDLISQNRPILLDGALGTELNSMGVSTSLPLWSAGALGQAPDAVLKIHQAYVAAGAQIITANTFRTSTYTYALAGLTEPDARKSAKRATAIAIRLALEASQGRALVAGSIPPVGDCYTPADYPGAAVARKTYGELIPWIAEAGAQLFLLETHINLEEALIALDLATSTGLPVLVSFLVDSQMKLYSGTPLSTAVQAVESAGASGVLVNCITLPLTADAVTSLNATTSLPYGVYANGSISQPAIDGTITELETVENFLSAAAMWLQLGCTFIGGCCGTTPAIIAALAQQIKDFAD